LRLFFSQTSESEKKRKIELARRIELWESWLPERDGVWMCDTFWEIQDKINALEIKEGDVWIVTFPKSGTDLAIGLITRFYHGEVSSD